MIKKNVMKDIYPKQEMRSMGDADILIRAEQYDKIVPILKNNGFTFVKESSNELCWEKLPFYIELHRYLVSPSHKDYFKVYSLQIYLPSLCIWRIVSARLMACCTRGFLIL